MNVNTSAGAAAGVSPEALHEALRGEVGRLVEAVADAVNAAPDGAWIRGSEYRVHDLMAGLHLRGHPFTIITPGSPMGRVAARRSAIGATDTTRGVETCR